MSREGHDLSRTIVRLDDGFDMDVFVAGSDAGGATILLLSPIFGVDPVFTRTVRQWADKGYRAVAPDYFGRVFPGAVGHTDEGFRKALRRVKAVDRDRQLADLRDLAVRFGGDGPLFVGGYCAGGEPALRLALGGTGSGFVIFHAARLGLYADRLGSVLVPLDIHFGEADTLVPPDEVERVRAGAAANSLITITVHPGAVHGFTQDGSRNYQPAAADASFAAALSVLDRAAAA